MVGSRGKGVGSHGADVVGGVDFFFFFFWFWVGGNRGVRGRFFFLFLLLMKRRHGERVVPDLGGR